ncbi:hypothetical protein RJ640_000859 [Escallonia rubra]|uniref:Uncharacterized protein n=1 Tax=Escallonia rubra TaxID=112253 RepID=A0AA88RTR7_9ASTE|nr:hypothetical protein RJ640_000859 [Escallonia rubra]
MEGRDNAPKLPAKKVAVALASLFAMVAKTTTFPIDITKTRLQLIESPSTRRAGNIDRTVAVVAARTIATNNYYQSRNLVGVIAVGGSRAKEVRYRKVRIWKDMRSFHGLLSKGREG